MDILNKSRSLASKIDPSTFSDILTKMGTDMGKSSQTYLKAFGDGAKDLQSAFKGGGFKTIIGGFEKMLDSSLKLIVTNLIKVGEAILHGMDVVNKTWAKMYSGGIEGSMKVLKDQMLAPVKNTAMGKVMSGFMDNLISSMMFRFEEGLKWRETRQAAAVQMGAGAPGAGAFASGVTKWNWALGRAGAAEAGSAMAGQGFTDVAVFDKMLGMSKQMGMNMQEAAKELRSYAATGLEAQDATKVMETNFRKLQSAAAGTTLPVKEMSGYVTQAATAARFMNVDIGLVGTAMAGLVKQSKELSGFGLDMRIHGQGILKDFTTGGSKMTDAMYAFYGSKGGTESRGIGFDWMAGKFGEKAASAVSRTKGGGFTFGGEDVISGNKGMENRLRVQLKLMQDAAAGAADEREAFLMMVKAGTETLGLSEQGATALAAGGEEGLNQILNEGGLASEFKSTNQIMGELQTGDARREQLQRLLVKFNMEQLEMLLKTPDLFQGLGKIMGGDKEGGLAQLGKAKGESIDTLTQMLDTSKDIGKLLQSTDKETFDKLQELFARLIGARAEGGPVAAGSSYIVGERGPELFTPGASGGITPTNQLASGGGGVTINLAVSGFSHETKDVITKMIVDKMNSILG